MFCSECGSANADKAKFCYQCGSAILFPHSSKARLVEQKPLTSAPKKKNSDLTSVRRFLLLCAFVILGFVVLSLGMNLLSSFGETRISSSSGLANTAVNAANVAPTAPVKQLLIDETVQVSARSLKHFTLNLNESTRVYGSFGASGGSNDIDRYIVDEAGFIDLVNGNGFQSYYSKRNVTIEKIDLQLVAGNYYLVFDNRKAILTDKIVKTKVFTEN